MKLVILALLMKASACYLCRHASIHTIMPQVPAKRADTFKTYEFEAKDREEARMCSTGLVHSSTRV